MVPDLFYPLERIRTQPLDERRAQGRPVVLPEVQDSTSKGRRLGNVERSLSTADQTFTLHLRRVYYSP